MIGGVSSCQGILVYDTSKEENNAVYGYYEDGEIVLIEGIYEELRKKQKEAEKIYKKQNHLDDKILYGLFILMLSLCIISFFICSFQIFLGILFFCVLGFFPILVLCYAQVNMYDHDECYHQMRKYHGCEHAIVRCINHQQECTLDKLKKTSIYDSECGTVYSGTILLVIIYISLMMMNHVSLLIILRNVIVVIIVLFINLFNPYNPFKLFQYRAVEKPTDKEYLLGIEMIKKMKS